MKPDFFIKYKSSDPSDDSDIDLTTLGESIIGLDYVIKNIFQISKIQGDIKVKIVGSREGSVIIDTANAILNLKEIPFIKTEDLLNFLQVADQELYLNAKFFFTESKDVISLHHKSINEYFAKNPFDQEVLFNLFPAFILYMIGKAQGQKKYADHTELPEGYANALHRMIRESTFKKFIKPIIEEKVNSIEMSTDRSFNKETTIIDFKNFDFYLSEEEKILPLLEDGKIYDFVGKIVAMQQSVGDSLTIKVHAFKKGEKNLVAYPPSGQTTKDLEEYYTKEVAITARVSRKSLYQKPKLYIETIKLLQEGMF